MQNCFPTERTCSINWQYWQYFPGLGLDAILTIFTPSPPKNPKLINKTKNCYILYKT